MHPFCCSQLGLFKNNNSWSEELQQAKECMEAAAAHEPQPAFIFVLGDLVHAPVPAHNTGSNAATIRTVRVSQLRRTSCCFPTFAAFTTMCCNTLLMLLLSNVLPSLHAVFTFAVAAGWCCCCLLLLLPLTVPLRRHFPIAAGWWVSDKEQIGRKDIVIA